MPTTAIRIAIDSRRLHRARSAEGRGAAHRIHRVALGSSSRTRTGMTPRASCMPIH